MSDSARGYTAGFEKFLEKLGVSGKYFCEKQLERWRGQVREAYEKVEESAGDEKSR